jgi:hypothetical protein
MALAFTVTVSPLPLALMVVLLLPVIKFQQAEQPNVKALCTD